VRKVQNIMEVNLKTGSKRNGQFAAPIDKPTKTPLSTLKQHGNSHGVPGGPGLDVDVFEFEQRDVCKLSNLQPSSSASLQCQFATPVYQFQRLAMPDSNMNCTLRGNCYEDLMT
jgi:hypothetical protein